MHILVAGGAGFLGSHLVDALLARESADVHVYVIDSLFTGRWENLTEARERHGERLHLAVHDVVNELSDAVLCTLFGAAEAPHFAQVYNLACPASPVHYQADPVHTLRTSVWGAYNLLELCKRHKARYLISSTSEVYGDPEVHPQPESYRGCVSCTGRRACYDEGKRAAETLAFDYYRGHGVEIRVARIFNTYGPRMLENDGRIISNFVVQAIKGEPITVYGDGSQTRSFCFVSDLVAGLIALMNGSHTGPINLGNPDEHSISEMAELIREMTNSSSPVEYHELPADDPKVRKPIIELAQKELKWSPKVQLHDGLVSTIEYFRGRLTGSANGADAATAAQ